jgi:pyruvate, orthophosphate dikinase
VQYVFDFSEGTKDDTELLGGKGANLAEMTKLGLPVPPGFTISTAACRHYLSTGREPDELTIQLGARLAALQERTGKRLGDPEDPLLVSVRSGAKFSMPGMMDTVLNVGLNDMSVRGLAAHSRDERFAWDSYRRLIQMFGKTVLGIDGERFDERLETLKKARNVDADVDLDTDDMRSLVDEFKDIVHAETGRDFQKDPRPQLEVAVRAVFD